MAVAEIEKVGEEYPAPLEFLAEDYIAPENQDIIDEEARRWRLLTRWERWRLGRYVRQLARDLQRADYNGLIAERRRLTHEFKARRAAYHKTAFTTPEAQRDALRQLRELVEQGHDVCAQLDNLAQTADQFEHYAGWLEYEREHRADLQVEARREKQILKAMRKEFGMDRALASQRLSRYGGLPLHPQIQRPQTRAHRRATI